MLVTFLTSNKLGRMRSMISRPDASDNPKPASAEGASSPDGALVGGLVDRDQTGPSSLLNFRYVKKQDMLIFKNILKSCLVPLDQKLGSI